MKISIQACVLVSAIFCLTPQLASTASNSAKQKSRAKSQPKSNVAPAVDDSESAKLRAKYDIVQGKQIYDRVCFVCHSVGVMNAPKFSDVKAWKPRVAQGMEVLVKHSLQDYKNMPAKGGFESLTITECGNAVAYMVDQCYEPAVPNPSNFATTVKSKLGKKRQGKSDVAASKASTAGITPELSRADLSAKYDLAQGKQTYERTCMTCHSEGVMEAPKFCDITAWKPRIARGMTTMVKHTVEGFNNMPSKGGMESLTIVECGNAVAYMVEQCIVK
jgi:cytochrome c5